ncbi:MAG: hypothetical protein ACREA2_08790 [Blastocatellia bacterium]
MTRNKPQIINANTEINDPTVANDSQTQPKGIPTPQSQGAVALKSSVAAQDNLLGDLEPSAEVKGGTAIGGLGGGSTRLNHNETTTNDEDEDEPEALNDLPVEDNEQVKGGPGGYGSGGVLINHNETTAEDDEAEADALDDLPAPVNALPDLEPEDEVVGGALKGKPQHLVDSWTQHNETMAEDED